MKLFKILALLTFLLMAAALAVILYQHGFIRLNNPDRKTYPVRGIDVSHHQGRIDWPAVAGQGIAFAYIKATEGTDFRDRRFQENREGAAFDGIAWGAFHFFTFCTPGTEQAGNYLEVLGADRGDLPPAADVEFGGNCKRWESIEKIRGELRIFLDEVEAVTGRKPVIYATGESYERIVAGNFPDHPLWIREIIREPGAERYGEWTVWQYANRGRLNGIEGPVDLNVFAGSEDEFQEFTGTRRYEDRCKGGS